MDDDDRKQAVPTVTDHLSIVFIGHVDAGKSTIAGQILLQSGRVDRRTIEKYEKEAKDKKRDSWFIAFIMDTSEDERSKGKTVETGTATFQTGRKRYTILDAPGHKSYVPNMIAGTSQADIGVLVVSARQNEFEAGFDRGGQTREHVLLAKTLGLSKLIVLVNKMDEPTVRWNQNRFAEIESKLAPFLKSIGFPDSVFVPASGFTGDNLKNRLPVGTADWYTDGSLFDVLDGLEPIKRHTDKPVRLPISARYKELGSLFVVGKLESGRLTTNDRLMIHPSNTAVDVLQILVDETIVQSADAGNRLVVKLKNADEETAGVGFVLSSIDKPVRSAKLIECLVKLLDLLPNRPLFMVGYTTMLHVHTATVGCSVVQIKTELDRKTGLTAASKPRFLKSQALAVVVLSVDEATAIEKFDDCPQLGRFTLRDQGQTIAVGKILNSK